MPAKTKTTTKKPVAKKASPKKVVEPVLHIPAEKEIKKRNLLLFIILVLLVGFIFFITSNVTTNKKFNLAQNELTALENLVNDKESQLNNRVWQIKTAQAKLTDALTEEVNHLQQTDQTLTSNIEDTNSQIAAINATIEYMSAVNEALTARDTELNTHLEDFYAEMLEQKIIANSFLIKMHEKQLEYLNEENKSLLKTKFEAMELTAIPEQTLTETETPVFEVITPYSETETTDDVDTEEIDDETTDAE